MTQIPLTPRPVTALAHVFSVALHPLLMPVIAVLLIVKLDPVGIETMKWDNYRFLFVRIFVNLVFFPGATILLLSALGLIKSVQLKTRQERFIPYIAVMLFYIPTAALFIKMVDAPLMLRATVFGAAIAAVVCFLFTVLVAKVSVHMSGIGVLTGLMMIFPQTIPDAPIWLLPVVIIASGMLATSRIALKAHTEREVYIGYGIGIFSQLLAFLFLVTTFA